MKKEVVVIGGGPAGLTTAYELTKVNLFPLVLEKMDKVGGLARTEDYRGFLFDMGGHRFFTKSQEVNTMWQEVLPEGLLHRPRLSRIYYKRKFFHYPLKPLNVLIGLGFLESALIIASYLRWQLHPYKNENTFEQWVTNRFGKRLFQNFFESYTEKVWGISCSELRSEWASQRIKDLSVGAIFRNMLFKPQKKIRTLIEEFDYPCFGPGMMWNEVKNRIEGCGGTVSLRSEVIAVRWKDNFIKDLVISHNGHQRIIQGTDFISSMPITEFVSQLDPPAPLIVQDAAKKLRHRDFLTVCLIVDKPDLFPDNWIYVHDPEVKVGRIQNFKNWSLQMVPDPTKTGLGLEYFCDEGDSLWTMMDSDLIELGKREIDSIGLANYTDIEDGCVFRLSKSYPVYDSNYHDCFAIVKDFVSKLTNFQTIGRNGLHRYDNQDHAILSGMLAVRNLVLRENNNLWHINTDQAYYEEVTE